MTGRSLERFHDLTLVGVAMVDKALDGDQQAVDALMATTDPTDLVTGLVHVTRYLLGIIEGETGAGRHIVLDEVRTHAVDQLRALGGGAAHGR
jgi:hypothetical protein